MIKRLVTYALALVLVIGARAGAQETPPPDFMEYNDPAMHFRAPDAFTPVAQRVVTVDDLGEDQADVIAAWVLRTNPAVRILVQGESFNGNAAGFSDLYQQQLRNLLQNALIKSQETTHLKNGMPAIFIDVTSGEGFTTQKYFAYLWADGKRGMVLAVTSPLGACDLATAKRYLADASAVRYPTDR
jgi:hypothetical protein